MSVLFIKLFLIAHVLVSVAGLGALVLRYSIQRGFLNLSAPRELKLNYFFIALCLLLPLACFYQGNGFEFQPIAKVASSLNARDFDSRIDKPIVSLAKVLPAAPAKMAFNFLGLLLGFSLLIGFFNLMNDFRRLFRIVKASFVVRSLGQVRIAMCDDIEVPFSVWWRRSWVIIPSDFLAKPSHFKIGILHELQHHRQKDTLWIYVIFLLKTLLFVNPLLWLWSRSLSEVQEIACDESLIQQKKVKQQEYARCLIEIAESAIQRKQLVCAAGLAFLSDRHSISRRIKSMLLVKNRKNKWAPLLGLGMLLTLATTAFAARNLVVDHRISMDDAKEMMRNAKADSEFPIVVNELVLHQLNRYLGTDSGRRFVRDSIERMQNHKAIIESKLAQYNVPKEMLAVPLVESGYQNLPARDNKPWGAGIWMFIASTAKNYGLKVDANTDERLNIESETDAAMRLLTANKLRFKDWLLSLMAYNMGEGAVQKAMDKTGSKDAWVLIRAGFEGDKDYLAKVMAIALILENPNYLK